MVIEKWFKQTHCVRYSTFCLYQSTKHTHTNLHTYAKTYRTIQGKTLHLAPNVQYTIRLATYSRPPDIVTVTAASTAPAYAAGTAPAYAAATAPTYAAIPVDALAHATTTANVPVHAADPAAATTHADATSSCYRRRYRCQY